MKVVICLWSSVVFFKILFLLPLNLTIAQPQFTFDFTRDILAMNNNPNHIHLGSAADGIPFKTFTVNINKSNLVDTNKIYLTAESNISTGYMFMCLGILKADEYKEKNSMFSESLHNGMTREQKREAGMNGVNKYNLSVTGFKSQSSYKESDGIPGVIVGDNENSLAILSINRDIEIGSYVVLIGYGSPFRDETFNYIKELNITISE
ncbi:hypothetical protein BdWA1_000657 [Babesia duncani]|uniref:Uncharacterized protein n=1 Tax=Babesia duncani TaxID=323732 RepID=A0AAD9PMK4_9APIC|nr:hypothetical protein BdWA1_000657 [Babesia duncani]